MSPSMCGGAVRDCVTPAYPGARDGLEQRARSLELRSPSPIARRILEVCELDDLIEPNPDDNSKRRTANVAERSCGRAGP